MERSNLDKIDFKKSLGSLYAPSAKAFAIVDVPTMQFINVDGRGDPNTAPAYATAVSWLYTLSYTLKFASKAELGKDYTVPPLEGLWWADDMANFANTPKSAWFWTSLIMVPDFVTPAMYEAALSKTKANLGDPPPSLRLEAFDEGSSVQILHIGPYALEAPTISRLHSEFLSAHGLVENGHHHEIYLSDPRRAAPAKLKTIIRQPVRPAA